MSSAGPAGEPTSSPAWRYEFKYLVPPYVRRALAADLRAFAAPDPHADDNGYYTVRSLYLDSPDWACFYEKRAGESRRYKLRIRTYLDGHQPVSLIKLEVKHRCGNRVRKDVTRISPADYETLRPALSSRHLINPHWIGRSPALDAFLSLKWKNAMAPVVNVQFRRRSFVARSDRRVRITLDDRLVARRGRDLFDAIPVAHVGLTGDTAILEVKLDRTLPFWMQRLIAKYGLNVQSMSKYCYAALNGPFALDANS